jgi:hypothetical protein
MYDGVFGDDISTVYVYSSAHTYMYSGSVNGCLSISYCFSYFLLINGQPISSPLIFVDIFHVTSVNNINIVLYFRLTCVFIYLFWCCSHRTLYTLGVLIFCGLSLICSRHGVNIGNHGISTE